MSMPDMAKFNYLVAQLRHILPSMRFNAARALGELGDPQAIDILLATMKNDASPAVRRAAAIALSDLGVDVAEYGYSDT
ncbi:MAG: HEAT repeat domain-containing protein [Chloroflexi bacterium]|nr:HEAT repeat domain-containing protein [Chloroflexota bacterium]